MSFDLLERAASALGDLTEEVGTRTGYYAFEERLRSLGFRNDRKIICRWHHPSPPLILDAMPTDAALLGFANKWQRKAFPHAAEVELPSGPRIKAVPPSFLLATKLEAYLGRGKNDLLASRDWADIVALVDGRAELVEIAEGGADPRRRACPAAPGLDQSGPGGGDRPAQAHRDRGGC
jgi:hypothetical protein